MINHQVPCCKLENSAGMRAREGLTRKQFLAVEAGIGRRPLSLEKRAQCLEILAGSERG
jgi:hypothetical protein